MPRAIVVSLKRDRFTVGRPRRLPRFEQLRRDALRLAAAHRQDPEAAEEIDRDPAPIRRHRGRHRGAFGEGDVDVADRRNFLKRARDSAGDKDTEDRTEDKEGSGAHYFFFWRFDVARTRTAFPFVSFVL